MKRLTYSGVRPDSNNFAIDYTYNYPEDIIDIVEPQLYMSIHNNKIFHFGKINHNCNIYVYTLKIGG